MRPRILLALIFALLIAFGASGVSFASELQNQLDKADQFVIKAKDAKRGSVRDENYKKAIDTYAKVIKKSPKTPEAAQALYKTAVVYRTAKGKHHNVYTSYQTLTSLINQYDKPASAFENLEEVEIREIRNTVAAAKDLKLNVTAEADKEGSTGTLYKIMDFLVAITGRIPAFSYWFAIVLVTVIIKLAITPLTKAQYKSMKEMQKVAPLIKQIQEEYKGDQKAIGEKTMQLYKEHNINPFAGCLPLLVQMPVLMVVFYMIKAYEFQFAKASFLWIGSGLSHISSVSTPSFLPGGGATVWLTAKSLAEPDLILLFLYLISMYVSTKMSAVDPTQADQQKMMAIMMPLMFGFIFAGFPAAFLLYWLGFNIFQTVQQYLIMKGGREVALQTAPAGGAPAIEPPSGEGGEESPEGEAPRPRRRRRKF